MCSRRKFTAGIAVFLFAAGFAAPVAAQQAQLGSWEELNSRARSLYQQGEYSEGALLAEEAL